MQEYMPALADRRKAMLHAAQEVSMLKTSVMICAILSATYSALAAAQWQEDYLALVRKEPKVIEAIWPNNSSSSFWASVKDDGTNREGFAHYLCLLTAEASAPANASFNISIWDAREMAAGNMSKLGEFWCDLD